LRPDEDHKLFERRVWAPHGIAQSDALDFDTYVKDRGQQFLESLDDWLSTRETEAMKNAADPRVKVGVAVYMFVRPQDEPQDSESLQ
jgi:hypothetical protein